MRNFVDTNWYKEVYGGEFEGEQLAPFLVRAGHIVDVLTHGRAEANWERLTGFQRKMVQRAICLMVDHFAGLGGDASVVESYSIGDMRVWNRRRRREMPWEVAGCGFLAWETLMKSGLMQSIW